MSKEILMFSDIELQKNKFYHHKSPIFFKACIYSESISI